MNKKKYMAIIGIFILVIFMVILIFISKNKKVIGDYYIKVNDGTAPGVTYTLNINKNGEYKMIAKTADVFEDRIVVY